MPYTLMNQDRNGFGGSARTQSEAAMDEARSAKRPRPAPVPRPAGESQTDFMPMEERWDGLRAQSLLLHDISDEDEVLIQVGSKPLAPDNRRLVDIPAITSAQAQLRRPFSHRIVYVAMEPKH